MVFLPLCPGWRWCTLHPYDRAFFRVSATLRGEGPFCGLGTSWVASLYRCPRFYCRSIYQTAGRFFRDSGPSPADSAKMTQSVAIRHLQQLSGDDFGLQLQTEIVTRGNEKQPTKCASGRVAPIPAQTGLRNKGCANPRATRRLKPSRSGLRTAVTVDLRLTMAKSAIRGTHLPSTFERTCFG